MTSMSPRTEWPDDLDGDVFRRMQANGFQFDRPADIDFNIDFHAWPPESSLLDKLNDQFGGVQVHAADDGDTGYITVMVTAPVTYALVMSMQQSLTALAAPGGYCESWGVLQDDEP